MPSTVYKGDLTEISFGHESSVKLPTHFDESFVFSVQAESASDDTTTIRLTGTGGSTAPIDSGKLAFPVGMLVGCELTFSNLATGQSFDINDNYATSGRRFTILKNQLFADTDATCDYNNDPTITMDSTSSISVGMSVSGTGIPSGATVSSITNSTTFELSASTTGGNLSNQTLTFSYTDLTITPKMFSGTSAATTDFGQGTIHIHSFKTPTMDSDMEHSTAADDSSENVLTDQFMGLINTVSLPETKVDLKRYHVIGLGRDVAVQVPGRFTNIGGSFETSMHSARWLYYALGQEVVKFTPDSGAASRTTTSAPSVGETLITHGSSTLGSCVGEYIHLADTDTIPVHLYKEEGSSPVTYCATDIGPEDLVTATQKNEIRRIAAYYWNSTTSVGYIWLDDGLNFQHDSGKTIKLVSYDGGNAADTTPTVNASTRAITNPVNRMLFSKTTVPSFAMEVSIRRLDNQDEDGAGDEIVDGGATDAKQLTRVFKGCKVKEFSMVADTDAAVRMNIDFDAALCYTDTGRLESTKGDRYDVHRIFEDTANTEANRRKAGIGKGTQKPYMFYNGTVDIAGVRVGQVISFDLKGKTGVEQFYTISGNKIEDAATDQIPFAGARNASLAVEGKTEYELDMEIIVDDPVFYHELRRAVRNFDNANNMVRLSFTKQGTSSASGRESMDIVMDDYNIVEASLPIPDDQSPIKSKLKILPKSIRVFSQDTIFHY